MKTPFFRKGDPVRVPFTASSAATPFDMPANMAMSDRKTFMFVNESQYDVRLSGTSPGAAFNQVSETTGWPVPARSIMGPFTSQNPAKLSCQAYSTPGNPFPQSPDFSNCFLELIYGEGE